MCVRKGIGKYFVGVNIHIVLGAAKAIFTLKKVSYVKRFECSAKKIDEVLVPHAQYSFTDYTHAS